MFALGILKKPALDLLCLNYMQIEQINISCMSFSCQSYSALLKH